MGAAAVKEQIREAFEAIDVDDRNYLVLSDLIRLTRRKGGGGGNLERSTATIGSVVGSDAGSAAAAAAAAAAVAAEDTAKRRNFGVELADYVEVTHLGTLYVLDQSLDGIFTLDEIDAFVDLCCERRVIYEVNEFRAQLQAFCSLKMWEALARKDGTKTFSEWFSRLARSDSQDHPAAPVVYIDEETGTAVLSGDGADLGGGKSKSKAKGKKKKKGKHGRSGAAGDERETIEYIHANTVKVLHRVLRVKRGYGVDFDIFLSMLQQATEEEGLMPLASVEHDNYVALDTLVSVANDVVTGFISMMRRLNFAPNLASDLVMGAVGGVGTSAPGTGGGVADGGMADGRR